MRDDDSNPMSHIGYGRGDDLPPPVTQPMRKATMMYSIVDEAEARRRHGGSAAVAPTEEMPIVPAPIQNVVPTAPTTIKMIISQLTERSIEAWTALPQSVRDLMLTEPASFTLTPNVTYPNDVPDVLYAGVLFRWNGGDAWMLVDIKR